MALERRPYWIFQKIINSGQTINIFNIHEEQNLFSSKKYIYMVSLKSIHQKLTELCPLRKDAKT